jgi:serine/threonine protein kinase
MNTYTGRQLGSYRIIRKLGTGGFAEVYLGKHVQTNWDAAVKILNINNYPEETFRQEADILWHLRHPHIVEIKEFNIENGMCYLVMDYAARGSLRDIHPLGETLPQSQILTYVKQIADALAFMHNKQPMPLVHCDIKPQNFLMKANGDVLLSDFGIATEAVTTSIRFMSISAAQQPMFGTIHYIAPEQWQGRSPTPATDQYALGVVVYEWLCGQRPFTGTNPQLVAQAHMYNPPPPFNDRRISTKLEEVIMRALAKDPKDRFPSIFAFAQALEDAIQNRPVVPPQPVAYQNILQPPMGGDIWKQLKPSVPREGHNDLTEPVTPQFPSAGTYPLPKKSQPPQAKKALRRRRPPRFDWANLLEETRDRRFLFIGILCDLFCVIPLFLWLRDPHFTIELPFLNGGIDLSYPDWMSGLSYLNWVIALLLLAIITRVLCTATIKRRVALRFAWILTAYETFATFGLVIYLSKAFSLFLPILLVIVFIVAWFLNNFFYARKK